MTDTFGTWKDCTTSLLKQILPDNDEFKVETYTAVALLAERLNQALDTECRTSILYYQAEIFTWRQGSDEADDIVSALKIFPEPVVKMIGVICENTPGPITKNVIYILGRELRHSIDAIISWCQGTLRLNNQPTELTTSFAQAQRAISDIRLWDGYRLVKFMDYFDPYEKYQLSVLEGEGGICSD